MGRKGPAGHIRRYDAPVHWPISPKADFWAIKPLPGPHPIHASLPLAYIIRDVLGYATNVREVKHILNAGSIKIDGKPRHDYHYPVGVMDVIEITPTATHYRVLPHHITKLQLHTIDKDEATFKLARVENKTTQHSGITQLNLHDGHTILLKKKGKDTEKTSAIKTNDVLKLTIPTGEIEETITFEKGAYAVTLGGKNMGATGKIVNIKPGLRKNRSLITLETSKGETFQTSLNYVFLLGSSKPIITMPTQVTAK
jgi:small subunit ribosomal protein S4e